MSYKQGIVEAILFFKERNGSSMVSIKKRMMENLPKDKKWQNAIFLNALKTGVKNGELVQIKASYKLSPEFKKKVGKKAEPKSKAAKKVRVVCWSFVLCLCTLLFVMR